MLDELPVFKLYVPATHGVQSEAEPVLYVPAGQLLVVPQESDDVQNLPEGQA